MKKLFIVVMGVILALSIATGAIGRNKKEEPASSRESETEVGKPEVVKGNVEKVQAMVEAIDLSNRVVTLRLANGNLGDIKVDERVKDLPQVMVGDEVVVRYYESRKQVTVTAIIGGISQKKKYVTLKRCQVGSFISPINK